MTLTILVTLTRDLNLGLERSSIPFFPVYSHFIEKKTIYFVSIGTSLCFNKDPSLRSSLKNVPSIISSISHSFPFGVCVKSMLAKVIREW